MFPGLLAGPALSLSDLFSKAFPFQYSTRLSAAGADRNREGQVPCFRNHTYIAWQSTAGNMATRHMVAGLHMLLKDESTVQLRTNPAVAPPSQSANETSEKCGGPGHQTSI
jgi:hypothetical protein